MRPRRPLLSLVTAFALLSSLACAGTLQQGKDDDDDDEDDDSGLTDTSSDTAADADTDTDTDTDTDADADTDTDTDTDLTVADVQSDGVVGSVELIDVVVTTGLATASTSFHVQDEGGGAWSGLRVYAQDFTPDVAVGDVVTLVGGVEEYYDDTEIILADASGIVVTGHGTPHADVLTDVPADWEIWEGALVTLQDVSVLSDVDEYGQVTTNWGVDIDDVFYSTGAGTGAHYDAVTGVIRYSFEEYKLCPRSVDDYE